MTPQTTVTSPALADLYEADETAWLETSSRLIRAGRIEELDYANLAEFLESMAKRDRRQVFHRMARLIAHLLKWDFQPDHRSRSWERTVFTQRKRLHQLFESKTLRNDAEANLHEIYREAVSFAVFDTRKDEAVFPQTCPYTFDQILTEPLPS